MFRFIMAYLRNSQYARTAAIRTYSSYKDESEYSMCHFSVSGVINTWVNIFHKKRLNECNNRPPETGNK